MSDLIKIYNGSVIAGATDGDEVSMEGFSNPVQFTLNAAKDEEGVAKLAIRCKSGYKTYGNTKNSAYHLNGTKYEATGGEVEKWFFAKYNGYANANDAKENATWANSLTISDVITDTNTIFWVKATSNSAEAPQNDEDESIHVETVVEAV